MNTKAIIKKARDAINELYDMTEPLTNKQARPFLGRALPLYVDDLGPFFFLITDSLNGSGKALKRGKGRPPNSMKTLTKESKSSKKSKRKKSR